MASIPAGAQRRPQRPLLSARTEPGWTETGIYGTGQGRDFQFATTEGREAWARDAYRQAVNADTWHLGDKVDDKERAAILAGVGGATRPMYRGPDGQYYFQNARTVEDTTTRSHRAQHVAGKTMDQIAAAKTLPGEDEYVALRNAQSARAVEAARQSYAANDNDHPKEPNTAPIAVSVNDNVPMPKIGMRFAPATAVPGATKESESMTASDFLQAADDSIRLLANGVTGGYADDFAARADAFVDMLFGGDYDAAVAANLKKELAQTAAARERLGTFGTVVETAPGFIPVIGDISGLAADFKDYLENGDHWTAEDWALVAAGMFPGAPNRKTVKAGKRIVDDLLEQGDGSRNLLAQIEHSKANVLTVSEANRLGGEHKGLIHIAETPPKNSRANEHQAGTDGAFSDIRTQKFGSAALRYENPNKRGRNFIKFEVSGLSSDGKYIELVDAKTKLAIWSRGAQETTRKTLARIQSALDQNPGYRVIYEFADETLAKEARMFIRAAGFSKYVTVRTRAQ